MGDTSNLGPRTATRAAKKCEKIWWTNSVFFVSTHIAAAVGIYHRPAWTVSTETLLLAFIIWQAACFGITIGYHRLYSHRAFRAALSVRIVLAVLGSMAFQGSIKWWCLRHRLHHRFTDDPVHDPYAATRGLLFSHMGWIFFKPSYERMPQVDRDDLDNDPVVRFQHKYYVPLALSLGLALPLALGWTWNDPVGAFIWGGLVTRLAIWHCTFLVNSLAHWDGLQPYSDEDTSRGNLIMALLTCGEGNHNFHTFPQDFRSGPSPFDWDPSKWIIITLHRLGLATGLRRARDEDICTALVWMRKHGHGHGHEPSNHERIPPDSSVSVSTSTTVSEVSFTEEEEEEGEEEEEEKDDDHHTTRPCCGEVIDGLSKLIRVAHWDEKRIEEFVMERTGRCALVLDGWVVDVTGYLGEHPGGAQLLRKYSFRPTSGSKSADPIWSDATWAFDGGLNNHSRAAKRRLKELRVARFGIDGGNGGDGLCDD